MHKPLNLIEPVQIEMDFNVPFTFKDSIAKVSRKNPMRGSILQSFLGELKRPVWNYMFDKEDSHTRAKRLIQFHKTELKKLESWYQ